MPKSDRLLFAAGAVFISGYFLLLTAQDIRGYFSPDDLMNLYRAWSLPLSLLIKGNLLFFLHSPYYRPFAEAWYRAIYYFAGFNPVPFKTINLLILLANLFLTYSVARRLSKSRAVAALATLFISYHGNFVSLHADTGFIYDVLCYFFYFWALAWYLRIRDEGRFPRWGELAACCVLYICALNSKEMAVSFPVSLLGYESLMEGRSKGWFLIQRWYPVLVTGMITLLFIVGRIHSPDSLLANDAYKPVFTWDRFMETSMGFTSAVLYAEHWFTPGKLWLLWLALLAYALAARSRTLLFAWLFFMIAPLPIAFVLPRGGPQYYIPFFGWTLYTAALLIDGVDVLLHKLPAGARPWTLRAAGVVLVVGSAFVLYPYEKSVGANGAPGVAIEGATIRSTVEQLRALHPRLPARARLFFLEDPLTADWNLLFLVRLNYRDDSLVIDTARQLKRRPLEDQLATYDHVFDYRGGHLIELGRPWQPGQIPAITIERGRPRVFHSGFLPVTRDHPALPSEYLIAQAFDLGATDPSVAPGERFPRNPLARVVSNVEVRVNGERAEVGNQIGWPAEVNRYRVDFSVPQKTAPGVAKVTIAVGGVTGPPVEIPVQAYVESAKRHAPAPAIIVEGGRPQVFHRDWAPVTRDHPARPGEDLITKALDLGETRPSVPQGKPFPRDPLVDIISKVEVRINGRPADTSIRVGWPEEINRYRVDIHIPEGTRAGMARVTLSVNQAAGPAVEIPVR